jgi:hypothetical protein
MDKATLREDLERADRHVADAQQLVERQRKRVRELVRKPLEDPDGKPRRPHAPMQSWLCWARYLHIAFGRPARDAPQT